MTLVDSLMVSLLGLAVVFLMLILLSFLVKLQSVVLGYIMAHKLELDTAKTQRTDTGNGAEIAATAEAPEKVHEGWSAGELKLWGVDEKTAAMIMAIVSDECQIPLSELQFKMIKVID